MADSDTDRAAERPNAPRPAVPGAPNERIVHANGVDLCVETFGDPAAPAVLLIQEGGNSMLSWAEGFCERLAAGPRFVIRYDHRDTGRSVCYPPGAPQYAFRDLVDDAMGVLDAFGLAEAHLVGFSTGGMLGQLAALDQPARVASLTLASTRSVAPGTIDPDLDDHDEGFMAELAEADEPDWADRASVIEHLVRNDRRFAARSRPFDDAAARGLAGRIVDRATDIATMTNIFRTYGNDRWRERLVDLAAPTLVLHGTEDRLFPYGNGVALAEDIPGARLLPMPQTGHELPPRIWDTVVPAILEHTSGR